MNRRSVKHTLTMTCLMLVLLASLLLGGNFHFQYPEYDQYGADGI